VLDGRDRVGLSSFATAGPTGLINMPDARFNPDGTLRFGMTYARPYFDLSANATLLPWLETNLAVTRITGIPGFNPGPNRTDSAQPTDLQGQERGLQDSLMAEEIGGRVAIGAQDPSAPAFSRNSLPPRQNPGGRAGHSGIRAQADRRSVRRTALLAFVGGELVVCSEYDASDYKNFPFAEESHVSGRRRGFSNAIEYRLG